MRERRGREGSSRKKKQKVKSSTGATLQARTRFRASTFPFVTRDAALAALTHAEGAKARRQKRQRGQQSKNKTSNRQLQKNSPSTIGLSPTPGLTLNGQCFMSAWIVASWNLRPISLFASKTVLIGFIAT